MSSGPYTMDDRELDAFLESWFADGAENAPDRIAEAAIRESEGIRQAPRSLSVPWLGTEHASLAWAAAIAAIVIGLGVYLGLTRFVGDDDAKPAPSTTSSARPAATPTAAPSVDAATSETMLGQIQWTRMTADSAIHPVELFEGEIWGSDDAGTWYVYGDGGWETADPESFGVNASALDQGRDGWAVISPDGPGTMMGATSARQVISRDWYDNPGDAAVIRRDDGGWTEVPLPDTAPPPMDGVRMSSPMISGGAMLDSDRWLVPVTRMLEVPWGDFYGLFGYGESAGGEELQVEPWPIWDGAGQVLKIARPGDTPFSSSGMARLRVELSSGANPTIRFTDTETGAVVHTIGASVPGWTPEEVLAAFRYWGLDYVAFVAYDAGETTVASPPWPAGEEWSGEIVTAFGRYYTATMVVGEDFLATAVHLWASDDGIDWRRVEVPELTTGPFDYIELAGRDDGLVVVVNDQDGNAIWASSDGLTWTRSDLDIPYFASVTDTDFGWLAYLFDSAAISTDGVSWEVLDLPTDSTEPTVTYLDGVFFVGPEETPGGAATWIGTFSP